MRYYPKRADANQKAIVSALTSAGCTVVLLHTVGQGCPDLLVGVHGETWLVEVKAPDARGEYRPDYAGKSTAGSHAKTAARQKEWAASWRGAPPLMVHSAHEALAALGLTADKPAATGAERFYPHAPESRSDAPALRWRAETLRRSPEAGPEAIGPPAASLGSPTPTKGAGSG